MALNAYGNRKSNSNRKIHPVASSACEFVPEPSSRSTAAVSFIAAKLRVMDKRMAQLEAAVKAKLQDKEGLLPDSSKSATYQSVAEKGEKVKEVLTETAAYQPVAEKTGLEQKEIRAKSVTVKEASTETAVYQPVAENSGSKLKEMCAKNANVKEVMTRTVAYQPVAENTGGKQREICAIRTKVKEVLTEAAAYQSVAENTGFEQKVTCAKSAKVKEATTETAVHQPVAENSGLKQKEICARNVKVKEVTTETAAHQPVTEKSGSKQMEICAMSAKVKEAMTETAAYQSITEDTGLTEMDMINREFETTLAQIDETFDNALPKKFQLNANAETFTPGMGPNFGGPETSHWQDALTLNGTYDGGYDGSHDGEDEGYYEESEIYVAQGSDTHVLEEEEEEEEEESDTSNFVFDWEFFTETQFAFLRPDSEVELKSPEWLHSQGFPILGPYLYGSRRAWHRLSAAERDRALIEAEEDYKECNEEFLPWAELERKYVQHLRFLDDGYP